MKKTILRTAIAALLPLGSAAIAAPSGAYVGGSYLSQRKAGNNALFTSNYNATNAHKLIKQEAQQRSKLNEVSADNVELVSLNKVSELVIIDASVTDKHLFYQQLKPNQRIVEIMPSESGIDQIAETLSQYQQLNALHLVSHAEAGELQLGTSRINETLLKQDKTLFTALNSALKEGADIHFYGCDLAAGDKGEAFLDIVQANTHADIAASDDLTGNAEKGGDWELEIQRGDITTAQAFTDVALKDFSDVLNIIAAGGGSNGNVGSGDGAASINASYNYSGQVFTFDGASVSTYISGMYVTAGYTGNLETSMTVSVDSGTFNISSFNVFGDGSPFTITPNSGAAVMHDIGSDGNTVTLNFSGISSFTIAGTNMFTSFSGFGISNVVAGDTTPPTFNSAGSTPTDDATNVSVTNNIVMDFSEDIAQGTGNITLKVSGGSTVQTFDVTTATSTSTPMSGGIGVLNDKVYLNPTSDLSSETLYAIRVDATAIDDTSGNSFVGISDDTTYNFLTEDVSPPTLNPVLSTPSDDATGVSVTSNIIVDFVENIQKGTGNVTIRDVTGNTNFESFDISLATTTTSPTAGAVGISNDKIYLNPTNNLAESNVYAIRIDATAIDDLSGNSFPGITNDTTLNFTTIDSTGPSISSVSLAGDNSYIDVTFNEGVFNTNSGSGAVESSDIDLSITGGSATSPSVTSVTTTGGMGLSGGETTIRVNFSVTGTPNGAETLEVDITDGSSIFDASGNAAAANQITNNTASLNDITGPIFNGAGSTPADNATNVSISNDIVLDFNESIAPGTGNITLKIVGGSDVEVFNTALATATTTPGLGDLGVLGDKLYINPTIDLVNGTSYAIRVSGTAIDDTSGNSFAGIADDTTFNFTTVATSATSTAAGFNTTNGTNLTPSFNFSASNETLTIAQASHVTGSTANGGSGTDTLSVVDGTDLSAVALSNFENLTLASGASVTIGASQLAQFSGTITAPGNESVTISGDGDITTLANIENWSVGQNSSNTRTITVSSDAVNINNSSTVDPVTFNIGSLTYTGSITTSVFSGDTLQMGNGSNINSAVIHPVINNLTIDSGASVTMNEVQHDAFTGIITATGANQITISVASDGFTTLPEIEAYVLGAANNVTLGTTAGSVSQDITGSSGNDTVNLGAASYTGILNGNSGSGDTLSVVDGTNITGASVSNFENLSVESSATISIGASQLAGFTGTITASGAEQINVSGDGNFTTLSNIETHSVDDDSTNTRTIAVSNPTGTVFANSADDAITFDLGSLTFTGFLQGNGMVNDTILLDNGADITGGTMIAIEELSLDSGATINMTAAQFAAIQAQSITAPGSERINIFNTGDVTINGNTVETYDFNDDPSNTRTINLGASNSNTLMANSGTDAITFDIATFDFTGSMTAEASVANTFVSDGANDISSATVTGFANLTLENSADLTMTVAQLNGFNGTITAAGTDSVILTSSGSVTGGNLGAIETFATGSAGNITVTIPASDVSNKTLTATTPASDSFTVTGSAGAQVINASSGSDNLTGGSGIDVFAGSTSNLNGDTITDLAAGETIRLNGITGLTLANVQFNGSNTFEIDTDATSFAVVEVSITTTGAGDALAVASVSDNGGDTDITFTTANNAPAFANLDGNPTHTEGGLEVILDADVTISDVELDALNLGDGNYSGATLTITRNGGANANDTFVGGGVITLTEGNPLTYDADTDMIPETYGTTTTNSAGSLVITFSDASDTPTTLIVGEIMNAIGYSFAGDNPPANVTLDWVFNDGTANTTGTNQTVVSINPVNDAPTDIAVSSTVINESATGTNATIATLSATDGDDTPTAFTLVSSDTAGNGDCGTAGVNDADNADFTISGTNLRTATALSAGDYEICIQVSDEDAGGAATFEETFTITIADDVAPVLAEVTPVTDPTTDSTPSVTFSSTEAGTIIVGGDCSSANTSATVGNNTITLDSDGAGGALLDGNSPFNCTITVEDADTNQSTPLSLTAFSVDTTAPSLDPGNSLPADGTTNIAVTDDIILSFDENILLGMGQTISIINVSNNVVLETFTASSSTAGTGSNGGTLAVNAVEITLTPGSVLPAGTNLAVQYGASSVVDAAGNAASAVTNNTTYDITTLPQLVISVDPTTIAETAEVATFTVSLEDADGDPVAADGNVTMTTTIDGGSSATGGGTDYNIAGTTSGGSFQIDSGQSSNTFTVTSVNDGSTGESPETVIFNISGPGGNAFIGSTSSATLTIVENSAPVITEGDSTELVIDLNNTAPFSLALNATDSDTGDTLTWSVSSAAANGSAAISGGNTGGSITVNFTPTDAATFTSDTFDIQVTDDASTPATDTITVMVLSIPQAALNDIGDIVNTGAGSGMQPDVDTYTRAGVTGVTAGPVLDLLNNAVRTQADNTSVDTAEELQVIVDAILEGQDADADGFPNIFEGPTTVDLDGDGIANRNDTDSDNDGIGDILDAGLLEDVNMDMAITIAENDTDSDGIVDFFDADVGNDGAVDTDKADANFDGVNDNWDTLQEVLDVIAADADGDGVPTAFDADDNDAVNDAPSIAQTGAFAIFQPLAILNQDGDSSANHLDLDADNDGVLDVNEYGGVDVRDVNNDALLDSGQAVAIDLMPLIDLGVSIDADMDNMINHLDVQSDGMSNDILTAYSTAEVGVIDANSDGRIDSTIDFDADGIVFHIVTVNDALVVTVDNSESLYGLRVPIQFSRPVPISNDIAAYGWMTVLSLFSLIFVRGRKILMLAMLLVMSFASKAENISDNIQWQVAVGQSEFEADFTEPGFSVTDERANQYSLSVGYAFHEDWLAQIRYADFGGYRVTDTVNTATIDYDALSLNVQATLPVLEDTPIEVYSMLGVAKLDRDSDVILSAEDDTTTAVLGLGVKGKIENATLGLEVTSYGEEVWSWSVTIGGHF